MAAVVTLKIGDRVRIHLHYSPPFDNKIGVITRIYPEIIAVKLDGNEGSTLFSKGEIEVIEQKQKTVRDAYMSHDSFQTEINCSVEDIYGNNWGSIKIPPGYKIDRFNIIGPGNKKPYLAIDGTVQFEGRKWGFPRLTLIKTTPGRVIGAQVISKDDRDSNTFIDLDRNEYFRVIREE